MLVTRSVLASIALLIGISSSLARLEAADATANALEGVRWVGPTVTLESLHGKTVVLMDYATWCPKCNKWSGDVCKQLKEFITDKPVVILAINNDETPANVRPYLEARSFFAPNIIHGYDPNVAKRNGLPDLWGYMLLDPAGKIVDKGNVGAFYPDNSNALVKKLQAQTNLGEFTVIDAKMSDEVKAAFWPMELGQAPSAELRKFRGEQKEQVDEALATYGEKQLDKIHKLAEGDIESQFEAYARATALNLQFKGTESAKQAKKAAQALETNAKFKRELLAKNAFDRCERTPATTSRASALKALIKRFDGTLYADKAKEALESAGGAAKTGKT